MSCHLNVFLLPKYFQSMLLVEINKVNLLAMLTKVFHRPQNKATPVLVGG
jgi:hypothetical protein